MKQQKSRLTYSVAAVCWTLFMLTILLISPDRVGVPKRELIPGLDKVVHFILFAILAFLTIRAIEERRREIKFWFLLILLSLFAAMTEVLQHFQESRRADLWDMMADVLGIAAILIWYSSTSKK